MFKIFKLRKTAYQKTKHTIKKRLEKADINTFDEWLSQQILEKRFIAINAYRIVFMLLKDMYIEKAIYFGEQAQKIDFDPEIEKVLETRRRRVQRNKKSNTTSKTTI